MIPIPMNNEQETKNHNRNIIDLDKNSYTKNIQNNNLYETRDMSWLRFNKRILELSLDKNIPLLERANFLSITSSNLDEFTMVRMANLLDRKNKDAKNILGQKYKDEFTQLQERMEIFLDDQSNSYLKLIEELNNKDIKIINNKDDLSQEQIKFIVDYFNDKVMPLLTPMVFDNTRPFPLIQNNILNIGVILKNGNENVFGTIQIPDCLDRVIKINSTSGYRFILIEDLIIMNLDKIFRNKIVSKTCTYRVLRDFDYSVADEKKVFITDQVTETLKRRKSNNVIRLDIYGNKKAFTKLLSDALKINKCNVNKSETPVDLTFLSKIVNSIKETDDKYKKLKFMKAPLKDNLFKQIKQSDILLHHPYDSYETVVDFIEQAAKDKDVVVIKQTLYRVTKDSPIMKALIKAAEKGKHVTVVLEVKARFDEENNIKWANELEKHGVYVVYGTPNKKVHCKMCLVIKKTNKGYDKYCHIGTGNYNEKNSKIYTDLSLFTSKKEITNSIEELFNYLTGFSETTNNDYVFHSPENLSTKLIEMIDKEIEEYKRGNKAEIIIKVNSLTDKIIIDKLYEASNIGVKITLIVRSACSLIKTSDNLIVKSIVGRYLEHSRIYYFANSGYFISSSDLMERNLYHRVELLVKVSNKRIINILNIFVNDNSCFQLIDGEYKKLTGNNSAQKIFTEISLNRNKHKSNTNIDEDENISNADLVYMRAK